VLTTRSAVWAVSLVTGKAVRVRAVGPYPYQVAFSAGGRTAYVLTRRALVAINVATKKVLKRIPQTYTPDGQILQVAPRGHALFLLNIGTGVVTEVSTATNTVLRKLRIGFCYAAGVFSADGRWLYLPTSSGVVAVNTASGAVSAPVRVANCGRESLLLAPSGKAIYAPGTGARNQTTVTRIDVSAGQLTPAWASTVDPAGGAVTMARAPDGSTLYVSTPLRKSVLPVSSPRGA
jgi:DNA-binding beta-propeller fold protein YncE